jgi:hypothetical protein
MTTTTRDVLAAARLLADDLLFPEAMRVDGLDVLPVAHLDALAAEGLYGASVPAQCGGLGLDLRATCAVAEELASGCLTTTFVWLQHRGLSMTLAAEGTPAALRDQWLGPVCRGQLRGGIALTGIIPGPPLLRARPSGPRWQLDGEAPWVTGWGLIDLLLVQARGPGDSIVSLILDAAAQPGLTVTRQRLSAVNASVTVRLGFDGVLVPRERFVGEAPFDPAESLRPDRMRINGSRSRVTGRRHGRLPGTPRRGDHRRCDRDGRGSRSGLGTGRPGHGGPGGVGRKPVGHRGPPPAAARPRGGVPAGVRITAGDQERAAATVRGQHRLAPQQVPALPTRNLKDHASDAASGDALSLVKSGKEGNQRQWLSLEWSSAAVMS